MAEQNPFSAYLRQTLRCAVFSALLVSSLVSMQNSSAVYGKALPHETQPASGGQSGRIPPQDRLHSHIRISGDLQGLNIQEAMKRLESLSGTTIYFQPGHIPSGTVNIRLSNMRLSHALNRILQGTGLTWQTDRNGVRVVPRSEGEGGQSGSPLAAFGRGGEGVTFAQPRDNGNDWWNDDNDYDIIGREIGRERLPARSQRQRASDLEQLIMNVIQPGSWRRREPDPEPEEEEEIWW